MKIHSPAFKHESEIPTKYTCDGVNISPPIVFEDVPSHAQSLVLIVEDPDVPRDIREDGMWNHWVVFNMPAEVLGIDEGARAPGLTGTSTRGVQEYGGPCPPDGEHRYFFKLFALDAMLDIPATSTKEEVMNVMEGHVMEQAEMMGRYRRPKV